MPTRRKTMTLDEHRQLGLALARIRDELVSIEVWLGSEHLPKNHRAVRSIDAAQVKIDQARSELENVMFGQHPDATTSVYYPDAEDRAGSAGKRG